MSSLSNQGLIECTIKVLFSEFFKQKGLNQDVLSIRRVHVMVETKQILIMFTYNTLSQTPKHGILKHFNDNTDYIDIDMFVPEDEYEFACMTMLNYIRAYIEYEMISKLGFLPIVRYVGSVPEKGKEFDTLDFRNIDIDKGRSNFQWA